MRKTALFLIILLIVYGLQFMVCSAQCSACAAKTNQTIPPTLEQTVEELTAQLPAVKVLPGQALYILKQIKEKIEIFTTYGAKNQVKLYLKFAETRLAEYKALRATGKEKLAERALAMYTEQLNQAIQKLEEARRSLGESGQAKGERETIDEAVEKAVEATQKHFQILNNLYSKAPEPAKQGLKQAIEASQHGYQVTKEIFSGQKREEIQEKTRELQEKTGKGIKDILKRLWPIL